MVAVFIVGFGLVLVSFFLGHNDKLKGVLTSLGGILVLVALIGLIFFRTCANCGWVNSKFATNCAKCGYELEEEVFKGDSFEERVNKLEN